MWKYTFSPQCFKNQHGARKQKQNILMIFCCIFVVLVLLDTNCALILYYLPYMINFVSKTWFWNEWNFEVIIYSTHNHPLYYKLKNGFPKYHYMGFKRILFVKIYIPPPPPPCFKNQHGAWKQKQNILTIFKNPQVKKSWTKTTFINNFNI